MKKKTLRGFVRNHARLQSIGVLILLVFLVCRPEDAMHHLGKLLMSLPVIRQVDDAMRRFWGAVRRSGRIPMNKLFVEMLEPGVR